jgi:signal peptidase II
MILLLVAVAVFAVDRATKLAVARLLPVNESRPVIDRLVFITHTQNTGAAFSLGHGLGAFFLAFAAIASVVIVYAYRRVPSGEWITRVALGLVLGGAVGNAFDRLLSSSVTDFIDVRIWPVFNVADSCIVVGALLLIWRLGRHESAASGESGRESG